jgi:hypothetical protein
MDLLALRTVIGATPLTDLDACRRELEHARGGRGLLDAREVEVLGRLDEVTADVPSILPEDELANAAKSSLPKALKIRSAARRPATTSPHSLTRWPTATPPANASTHSPRPPPG